MGSQGDHEAGRRREEAETLAGGEGAREEEVAKGQCGSWARGHEGQPDGNRPDRNDYGK